MNKRATPVGVILVVLVAAWFAVGKGQQHQSPEPPAGSAQHTATTTLSFPDTREAGYGKTTSAQGPHLAGPYRVGGVTVIDINNGRSHFLGTVDLRPTLDRIDAGRKSAHHNDGSVFRNSSRRLPSRPDGYYREYVVPTPGVRGPGPQRLVLGREGEIYYTADHYESFLRVDEG